MSNINSIIEIKEQEQQAFEVHIQSYKRLNPMPRPRKVDGIGWQFWIALPVTVSQIVLAAMRTAAIFYAAASLSGFGNMFALVEASAVMLAVEGGLVVYSAIRAANNAKSKSAEQLDAYNTRLAWGIGFMVVVSVLAGLGQSIGLIEYIDVRVLTGFQYTLSLVIGVGASVIAWIGGEVLGTQIAKVGIAREEAMAEYKEEMEKYWDGLRSSWERSQERKYIRQPLSQLPVQTVVNYENFSESFPIQASYNAKTFPKDMPQGMPVHLKDWRQLRDSLSKIQMEWILSTDRKTVADVFDVNHRTANSWKENILEEGLLD